MRMWMVDPAIMCRAHLLGEHVEMHMFIGAIAKGTSMLGFAKSGLLETRELYQRHDDLVTEMLRRGMNHNSPMPEVELPENVIDATVDREWSLEVLLDKCKDCQDRYDQKYGRYIAAGYQNRKEYLKGLAEEYGVEYEIVVTLADTLGPNEDFDGLVSGIQDYAEYE